MTELEAAALVLFKERTPLQLKIVLHGMEINEEERKIVLLAIQYHQAYISMKLKKKKNDKA